MTLGYLDWLLRAVMVVSGIWLGASSLAEFRNFQQTYSDRQQSQQVSVVPSPSPSVTPSPEAIPSPQQLSPLAVEVSQWDGVTIGLWSDFCQQTRNGLGYGVKEQGICRALQEVR